MGNYLRDNTINTFIQIFLSRLDKNVNKLLRVKTLNSALCYVDLRCQRLRAPAKQVEYRQRTMEYAKQKGRFLSKEEFSRLFENVVRDLESQYDQHKVFSYYIIVFAYSLILLYRILDVGLRV